MKLSFDTEGFEGLRRVLNQLPSEALKESVLDRATRAGAKVIAEEVKSRAPVGKGHPKFGHLKDNIKVTKVPKSKRRAVGEMVVHTGDAFWGKFLEFGTARMSAQPFMRPAFDQKHDEAIQTIGARMAKVIDTEAKKLSTKSFGQLGKARRRRLVRG